jgi:hypothetical protein
LKKQRRGIVCRECNRIAVLRYNASKKRKAADRRYSASAKGRAARRRYNATEHAKAVRLRYRASPNGKAAEQRKNKKQIRIGMVYVGRADSVEQAELINSHIKRRLREFAERRGREK